jgi:hypothetical protein
MSGLKKSFIAFLTLAVLPGTGSVLAQTRTWTTTQDFDQGESVNLNPTTVVDQLQINYVAGNQDIRSARPTVPVGCIVRARHCCPYCHDHLRSADRKYSVHRSDSG